MSEHDGGLLDSDRDPVAGPTDEQSRGRRRRRRRLSVGLGLAAAAVAVAVASLATSTPARPDAPGTSSTAAPSSSAVPVTKSPAAASDTTPTVDADPAALADLDAVAASLATPLALTSPTTWDRWLPEGKPYPGASLEEEISTCPRLADRLSAALGQKMSYWTGTLPTGPYGCTWVPVPLEYDSPDYDYVIAVGFVADGTTAASLARGFATADGPCPWKEVPTAAPGAVLVRCAPETSTEYTLALPDTRLPGGLWTLIVNVKDRAAVRPAQIIPVLIEGAVDAFG